MMMKAAAALVVLVILQDAEIKLRPGEPTDDLWPVTAALARPDETYVQCLASRLERRWSAAGSRFEVHASDVTRLRAGAEVLRKSVKFDFKAGTPGLYRVKVGMDEELLGETTLALGRVDALFKESPKHAQQVLKSRKAMLELVELLKDIAAGRVTPTSKTIDSYSAKVAAEDAAMKKVAESSDLTGTAAWLRHWLLHLRDVQIWNQTADNPMSKGDPQNAAGRKGFFVDPNLTVGDVEKGVKEAEEMLGREIRMSISALLAELFDRGVEDPKRLPAARKAAAAALALADAAPSPSKDFRELLEKAKGEQDPGEAKEAFSSEAGKLGS